jgi:DNA replication protein DnaC
MERAQIPPRFRQCSFEEFFAPSDNSSLQMALVKARGFAENYPAVQKGLLFMGDPGVGKTHLTVAILRHLMMQKGVQCFFCSFPDLLEELQDSYGSAARRSKSEILAPVLETEVLALDDLGARRVSEWVEDTVTYILNQRYNQKKPTLLTTNLPDTPDDAKEKSVSGKISISDTLNDRIGKRIYSRLFEMCEKVAIRGTEDYRQTVRQHTQSWQRGRSA